MTMHLLGPQFSTLSSRKRKSKVNVNAILTQDFNEYNKQMKRYGLKEKSLDEYIAYRQGKTKSKTKLRGTPIPQYNTSNHREQYPSYGDQVGSIPAKPEQKYTGTKIIGVAVLHKSCLQPVSSKQDAEDIAKMRRN